MMHVTSIFSYDFIAYMMQHCGFPHKSESKITKRENMNNSRFSQQVEAREMEGVIYI